MNNQPYQHQQTTPRQRLTIGMGLLVGYLLVSLIIGFILPHKDFASLYVNILASVAILGGVCGLYIYLARQQNWPLPSILQVSEGDRDANWRLLFMSLAAIAFPFLIIFTRSVLLHQ